MTKTPHSKWQILPPFDRHIPSWDKVTTKDSEESFTNQVFDRVEGQSKRPDELTALMQQLHYIHGTSYHYSPKIEAYEVNCWSEDAENEFREWVEKDVVPWGCTVVKAKV